MLNKQRLAKAVSLIGGLLLGTLAGAVAHAQTPAPRVGTEDADWASIAAQAPDVADEGTPDGVLRDMLRDGTTSALRKPRRSAQGPASYRVTVDVFKRPVGLGINKEFMVVRKDGEVERAYVISTAKDGKKTIEGRYTLTVEYRSGKPYPFHTSSTYANSPMYWGLNVSGGYWVHSTPHYGQLGGPASMGCVRTTFPAAMELFDLVANQVNGSAQMRIHASGAQSAKDALAAILQTKRAANGAVATMDDIRADVQSDLDDAHAITRGDYNGYGHARRGEALQFPLCKNVDCFRFFGRQKPAGAL